MHRSTVFHEHRGMTRNRMLAKILGILGILGVMVLIGYYVMWYLSLPVMVKSASSGECLFIKEILDDGAEVHHKCDWARYNGIRIRDGVEWRQ